MLTESRYDIPTVERDTLDGTDDNLRAMEDGSKRVSTRLFQKDSPTPLKDAPCFESRRPEPWAR